MPRFPDGYPPGHASNPLTLAQFLSRRREELEAQISAIRGELAPREAELAQINQMRSLLAAGHPAGRADLTNDAAPSNPAPDAPTAEEATIVNIPQTLLINGRIVRLTIKVMILAALRDHFKSQGATPSDIRDYIKSAYNREIDRNSISPQLARLRDQGAVEQYGLDGKWKLTRAAKWYDDPVSFKDLDKDEPPDPKAPNTRLGDMHANPAQTIGVRVTGRVLRTKKEDDFLD